MKKLISALLIVSILMCSTVALAALPDNDEIQQSNYFQSYGMAVSYYQKPEMLWSYDHVTSAYREDPGESARRILARAKELFPEGTDQAIRKMLK